MKAQRLSEYVETQYLGHNDRKCIDSHWNIVKYTKFLTQPLELWMFVPCKEVNGKWEVLEETNPDFINDGVEYYARLNEYQQALDKVIFKGWKKQYKNSVINSNNDEILFNYDGVIYALNNSIPDDFRNKVKTIEDIIHLVELTDKKAKEFKLC